MHALKRIAFYFLYAVCIALGLLVLFFVLNRIYLARQSLHWSSVEGEILWATHEISGRNRDMHRFQAGYRYVVNGVEYYSQDVSYSSVELIGEARETVEEKLARFKTGSTATVYYDPSAPYHSCLVTGGNFYGFLIPLGLGVMCIGVGVWGIRRTARPKIAT